LGKSSRAALGQGSAAALKYDWAANDVAGPLRNFIDLINL
jgi:hypothetical protein